MTIRCSLVYFLGLCVIFNLIFVLLCYACLWFRHQIIIRDFHKKQQPLLHFYLPFLTSLKKTFSTFLRALLKYNIDYTIYPFKVYRSTAFSIFTVLQPLQPFILEHFNCPSPPKKILYHLATNSVSPSPDLGNR